jgi:hypothetical protein
MKEIVSNTYQFVLVKLIGCTVIIYMMKNIIKQNSQKYAHLGMKIIICMMFLVVGNNLITIASAGITYGFATPQSLEYPGRVESTGGIDFYFIFVNTTQIYEFGTPNNNQSGGLDFNAGTRMISSTPVTIKFVITDWAHPYRIFGVDGSGNVFYTDKTAQTNLSLGYYTAGVYPLPPSNSNPIYKIGTITLNTKPSGFVDSNGDLYLASGLSVYKFTRSSDFVKTTYLTLVPGTDFTAATYDSCYAGLCYVTNEIEDIKLSNSGIVHILVGSAAKANCYMCGSQVVTRISHVAFSGTTRIYTNTISTRTTASTPYTAEYIYDLQVKFLLNASGNTTTNIILVNNEAGTIKARSWNGTYFTDICSSSCAGITSMYGTQILNGYIYISSSADNLIARYPTTATIQSGVGFTEGAGTGGTSVADIIYTTATIQSPYANYYNFSSFKIAVSLDMDSGYFILGSNYGTNLQNYRWEINLQDPNGVIVSPTSTGACIYTWAPLNPFGTCIFNTILDYPAPATGWINGSWTAKLYEADINNYSHRALIATANPWNVYDAAISANASIISPPIESATSGTGASALATIDGWTVLLGLGVNGISKFLFAVIVIAFFMVIGGLIFWKAGALSGAVIFAAVPYCFFTYIEYVPAWVIVILGIIVAMKIGFFR